MLCGCCWLKLPWGALVIVDYAHRKAGWGLLGCGLGCSLLGCRSGNNRQGSITELAVLSLVLACFVLHPHAAPLYPCFPATLHAPFRRQLYLVLPSWLVSSWWGSSWLQVPAWKPAGQRGQTQALHATAAAAGQRYTVRTSCLIGSGPAGPECLLCWNARKQMLLRATYGEACSGHMLAKRRLTTHQWHDCNCRSHAAVAAEVSLLAL